MCGIFGIVKPRKLLEKIKIQNMISEAFHCNVLRGEEGAGMFAVNFKDDNLGTVEPAAVLKHGMSGIDFVSLKQFDKFFNDEYKYKFIVGHNRATTRGKMSNQNSHPFKHGPITLVHNGTVIVPKNLLGNNDFAVDSEGIAYVLATHGVEALKEIKGPMAIVWFDERTNRMHLLRNEQKPMGLVALASTFNTVETTFSAFASEPKMMEWLAFRNGFSIKGISWTKPDVLYTYVENDSNNITLEYTPFVLSKEPPAVEYIGHYGRNFPQKDSFPSQEKRKVIEEEKKALEEFVNEDITFTFTTHTSYTAKDTRGKLIGGFLRKNKLASGMFTNVHTKVICYNIPNSIGGGR